MKPKSESAKVPASLPGQTRLGIRFIPGRKVCLGKRRAYETTAEDIAALEARMEAFGQAIQQHNIRRKG